MKIKELARQVLTQRENRRYHRILRGRRGTYTEWLAEQEKITGERAADAGESVTAGHGIAEPAEGKNEGDFVIVHVEKGVLAVGAEEKIGNYFRVHPEVQLLYGDEDSTRQDKTETGKREAREGYEAPWFKPDWSPDLLDSFFYFGGLTAMRGDLFRRAEKWMPQLRRETGDGAERYIVWDPAGYEKWLHICAAMAGGYRKGSRSIGHISDILFHGEGKEAQNRFLETSDFLRREEERLLRDFQDGWIVPTKAGEGREPVISVIIPSKDQPETLGKCLQGCALAAQGQQGSAAIPYEVIIVDNGSSWENRDRIQALTEGGDTRITYLYHPMEFHFSRMCNLGAEKARGTFLLFLNDDVELCQPGVLTQMAAMADRDYTGAVGLKLYYPDSARIQHAGITNLPMGPVHKLQFMEDDRDYYGGANRGKRNVLAVTAACLMVERGKFLEAGGFSEELRVAFNDVDFCFRLYELGYWNVCLNSRYAYHHESLSRGDDESQEKLERLLKERDTLYRRHPGLDGVDPYYSVHLNRTGLDTGIRPAYLTAGNEIRKSGGKSYRFSAEGYRPDACLMVRVEDCRGARILGYGIVLGDNNACYDRLLLLRKAAESPELSAGARADTGGNKKMTNVSHAEEIYALRLEGQYRPDLEENMPDQNNVALCGFHVEIEEGELPAGKYRLGLAAENRVSRLKLINWSNRFVSLEGKSGGAARRKRCEGEEV